MFTYLKSSLLAIGLVSGLAATSITANATIVDFTAAPFGGQSGISFFSSAVDGITVDVSSVGGNLNSATGFDGGAAGLALLNNVGLVGTYDGFGIGDDEVSAGLQSLTVDFSPAVNIVSVFLLDLFNGEIATLNVGGDFNGSNVAGGFLDILLNQTLSSITFTANAGGAINNNDFAIAGFEVAAVPLPAALPLLGAGFAALGFVGWRRKRKAA